MAAAQVRQWLAANLPAAQLRPAISNADAAQQVSDGLVDAAVSSPLAVAHRGLATLAEGVVVGEGSVLSMGVFIGQSTKIVDRSTGEVSYGRIPPYSVVVPGSMPGKPLADGSPGPSLGCAVIVKRVDGQTRAKTSINELLRD